MRSNRPTVNRLERRLRIQIRRRKILAAKPVAVRFVPLLFSRKCHHLVSLEWEFQVSVHEPGPEVA